MSIICSFVKFIIHDAVVIDLDIRDKDKLLEIKSLFENTDIGHIKSIMSVGKRLNDMKPLGGI